jgi:iron complex transport system permease protein
VTLLVVSLASTGGRISIPTLLLAGIAMNTLIAGLLAALQSITLKDYEVSRAILAWTFGTLDDRSGWQVTLVWTALVAATSVIPFVALELDLFAGGEEDAQALGVNAGRVKLLALVAAALATSAAVSVAGQIAFVGLVVPHVVRMLCGTSHRIVLPLSLLLGAVFLLGCDLLQRSLFPDTGLRPGVLMSLIGGPVFILLLVKNRTLLTSW